MLVEKLINLDNKNKDFETCLSKYDYIKQHCTNLSHAFSAMNPYFSCHDFRHSLAIIAILNNLCEELLDDNNKLRLNYFEIFLLLASCYLHDTGMIYTLATDKKMKSKPSQHYSNNSVAVRRLDHHIRSSFYINDHKEALHLDNHTANIISKICKGHGVNDLSAVEYDDEILVNDTIRLRLLTSLLRLGDLLDLSYTRIPDDYLQVLNLDNSFDDLSRFHYMKHLYTSGVVIGSEKVGPGKLTTINIKLRVPNPDHARRMNAIIKGPIEKEIAFTEPFLSKAGLKIKLNPIETVIDSSLFVTPSDIFNEYYKNHYKKMKILIIDNQLDYLESFKGILQTEGYSIYLSSTSRDAKTKLRKNKFDLILLDLVLESVDGGIKLLEDGHIAPSESIIFIISVLNDAFTASKTIELGAKKYFVKEKLDINELRNAVRQTFEERFNLISTR